ncbi:MAG: Eco57I restriction-modification methylase domain-containing protein [Spirochaetota bacterium]|nr:Eco57I restriction-modification methylase domain-containing protein [Spirochaetota bacterium]
MTNLISFAENLTNSYLKKTKPEYLKLHGQFFTPIATSDFMIRQFRNIQHHKNIKILDPGAGIGIFESAFCDFILTLKKKPQIYFELYEIDKKIIPFLKRNLETCKRVMAEKGIKISYDIFNENFILSKGDRFNVDGYLDSNQEGYDFVIANPPYFKIKKDSNQAKLMKSIVKGQPNIYALFMALSAQLLKPGGQMTVLTPRSYCSGAYFKLFRKWFFRLMKPTKIHVFESRKELFREYKVLQEMIILTAIKKSQPPKNIKVSMSIGENYAKNEIKIHKSSYKNIVVENDDVIIRIPTSSLDQKIAEEFIKLSYNLDTLGFKVSTGPVVPFRTKEYLIKDIKGQNNYVPLLWMQNIVSGKIIWPISIKDKQIAIINEGLAKKILVPKGNYVLIKRLSSKEGKNRIVSGVLTKKSLDFDFIGIENHMNYIWKYKGSSSADELYGISALLNSKLFNRYFQIINGSTQVNASEIRKIPFPSIRKIKIIGKLVRSSGKEDQYRLERIIGKELNFNKGVIKEIING